jgi:hypothetical protein
MALIPGKFTKRCGTTKLTNACNHDSCKHRGNEEEVEDVIGILDWSK